jgi:antitoxin component of MazEF toxin-antitoxin module
MIVQKVIRIGSSLGITLPKKELTEQNIMLGDELEITVRKRSSKHSQHEQMLKDLGDFMDRYDQDLKNLADR